ncbi:hypothetical protein VN97_g9198 [Penicillium thymicola]|uniref:Uncharacterized protein n=1 Tax=Penicillium thymicola TaxID=293382 RepID=A0AAI9TBF9_PENTH|nr:hypothetical protein VN97_g9198 [Penicillium thymicola]
MKVQQGRTKGPSTVAVMLTLTATSTLIDGRLAPSLLGRNSSHRSFPVCLSHWKDTFLFLLLSSFSTPLRVHIAHRGSR